MIGLGSFLTEPLFRHDQQHVLGARRVRRGSRMPPVQLFVKNTRRDFLAQGAALLSAPLFRLPFLGAVEQKPHFSRNPFTLGVASGDPLPDGFVIWTRLAPEPLSGGGAPPVNIEVEWEIAHDESMKQVVRRGTTVASPDLGHSVHVELAGLEPEVVRRAARKLIHEGGSIEF